MSHDQIQSLIKSFAEKGKSRSEILSELVHEGYDPGEIENAMNGLFSAGELPPEFWDGYGTAPQRGVRDLKKIILWIAIVAGIIVVAWLAWTWYQGTPGVISANAYRELSQARSFAFAVTESSGVELQGIAIVRSSPAVSLQIVAPQIPETSIIKKENENIVFKVGGANPLAQYAWLSAPADLFFSEAYALGLEPVAIRGGIIREFSEQTAAAALEALDRIFHGPVAAPRVPAPETGMRGIALNADGVFKRQLAEAILGSYDSDLLDEISAARWDLFVSKSGERKYILVIDREEGLIRATIQNLNEQESIPFDAVTTPLENALVWMREGR